MLKFIRISSGDSRVGVAHEVYEKSGYWTCVGSKEGGVEAILLTM